MSKNNISVESMNFLQQIKQLPWVDRIILYGSRARGDNKKKSDIDLAIDCPNATDKQWLEIIDIVENAETLLSIDCVRYDTLSNENPLKKSIDNDGKELFIR